MAAANPQQDFVYYRWAPATKTSLIEKGLWDVVENGVPPDPSKIPELASKIQPEELSQWRDLVVKDAKALQILQSSLTDSVFRKTLSASSAKDVWDLLEKGNREATIRRLEKQFEEVKKVDEESFDLFVDRVLLIVDQFRRMKIEKSDYQICEKLFASLPMSYDRIHSLLDELMNLHKMTASDLVHYFYTNGYEFESVNEKVLIELLENCRLQSKSEKWCGLCYTIKHNQEDCTKANEIYECGGEVEEYSLFTSLRLAKKTYDEDVWMIYPAATNHMTPYEKYFTTLDRTFKSKVGLADGSVLMVEGRGDVKVMMKDGKSKKIRNVIFVPGLNRNVLSLDQILLRRRWSFREEIGRKYFLCDRTNREFGETKWMPDENGWALRLEMIEGNLTS